MYKYLNFDTRHLLKIKLHKLVLKCLVRLIVLEKKIICKTSIIKIRIKFP